MLRVVERAVLSQCWLHVNSPFVCAGGGLTCALMSEQFVSRRAFMMRFCAQGEGPHTCTIDWRCDCYGTSIRCNYRSANGNTATARQSGLYTSLNRTVLRFTRVNATRRFRSLYPVSEYLSPLESLGRATGEHRLPQATAT